MTSPRSVEDDELNVPMMALVDYRGFRLIAMCLLPIRGDSLIYGSKDAGNTVHNRDPAFAKLMADAGKRLNLCPHLCGTDPSRLVELWSACDIEGHLGVDGWRTYLFHDNFDDPYTLGKYYLLDFSRTMPPVTPRREIVQGHLYRLFRKEFVQKYHGERTLFGISHY